jgi:serine/threonine protein kinase
MTAATLRKALREGHKLLRAKHKSIVQLHRVHDLGPILGNGSCAMEMEVLAGGDLFEHLEAARRRPEHRLPAAAVLRFSRQLLQALIYLHDEMKWLHGEIKPQNMFLQFLLTVPPSTTATLRQSWPTSAWPMSWSRSIHPPPSC